MNTQQHSVSIMAQVPPFQTVIISKAVQFWRTVFFIRDISLFSKDRLCRLPFKVCWVNSARALYVCSNILRPMKGTKTAAK